MFFPFALDKQYDSGLKRICDIQKADNGWLVTVYMDNSPTVDEVKNQIQGMNFLNKYFEGMQHPDEAWKQQEISEDEISNTVQNLMHKKRSVETHLFLQKEELLAFLTKIVG
jgi:hypothetical protein